MPKLIKMNTYKSWAKVPGTTAHKKWDRILSTHGELASEELRRIVLADPAAFKYGGGLAHSMVDDEVRVVLHAAYFTTVRNMGRGIAKDRREFPSLSQAIADRAGNPQVLIYGVVTEIDSTALSPKYLEFYTAVIAAVTERK